MFKNLKIKNFQSHENSELEFSPGINIVVPENESDPNDIGKTSIFRALQLLGFHRPMGGSYFPNNKEAGKTEISVKLLDDKIISLTKVIKKKEVKESVYGIDEKLFKGFSKAIPDQIVLALNLSEVNIQQQLDEPYLVTSSGGEVAKTINRITKIEQSDEWVSSLTTEINATNRDITKLKQEIKAKKSELKKYSDIDETVALVSRLEKIADKIDKYTDNYDNLLGMTDEVVEIENWLLVNKMNVSALEKLINETEKVFVEISSISKEEEVLQYLLDLIEDIEKLKYADVAKELDTLQKMRKEENQLLKEIEALQELMEISENVDDLKKVNIEEDLKSIQKMIQKIDEMQEEQNGLFEVLEIQERIDILINDYLKIKEEYILDLKKFGKCPTCLSIIGSEVIRKIAEEL